MSTTALAEFATLKQQRVHTMLQESFPFFAKHALKVKDKDGNIVPFEFNRAQIFLHERLEKQRKTKGMVRALVLKGRQQGCSTYIGARFYHRSTRKAGQSVFILSHEAETTKKLFRIVERYYEHTPEPLRPSAKIANKREYIFEGINSEYAVGTAGNKDVGRGGTIQLFHGSEVAFWENTDSLQTGILQSIPPAVGTEIILESTANGMGNMFYDMCMKALAGENAYEVIFIPWFWQEEYSQKAPHDGTWELSNEEVQYKKLYGLVDEQLYWRREKTAEFKSTWEFKQEYPSYLMEAFQTSGDTLIDPGHIMVARKSTIKDEVAPLIMGVDPARNKDRTVFSYRRGRVVDEPETFRFAGAENVRVQMQIAGLIAYRIDSLKPVQCNIDVGFGYGIIDRLVELGYGRIVQGVHFGAKAIDEKIYVNKRAEMWCKLRDWIQQEDGEVSIPDSDEVHKDLVCMPDFERTSNGRILLKPKDVIRKKLGMSPDIGDAIALTFAYPVAADAKPAGLVVKARGGNRHTLTALQRMRGGHNTQRQRISPLSGSKFS